MQQICLMLWITLHWARSEIACIMAVMANQRHSNKGHSLSVDHVF